MLASAVASMVPGLAPYIAVVFLLPAPFSAFRSWNNRRLLDKQRGISSIRALRWDEFEDLLAEYFRRDGYRVRGNEGAGADGGVDLWLENAEGLHLVQCKQWRSSKVGVKIVRELYGVMAAEGAVSGFVITSGAFTTPALSFSQGKSVALIDGPQLETLIASVQRTQALQTSGLAAAQTESSPGKCPRCGGHLVLRRARRGPNAGSGFYGCTSFPACRYTLNTPA